MANNTDIQIQMLSLEMPKNAIQRALWARGIRGDGAVYQPTLSSPSALDGVATLKTCRSR